MGKEIDELKKFLIDEVRRISLELGKAPTRAYCEANIRGFRYKLGKTFGTYTELLAKSGIKLGTQEVSERLLDTDSEKLIKRYKSLCSKKEQIQGFFRHAIDLDDLFTRAGNPNVLKVVAQPDTHVKYRDDKAIRAFVGFLEYYKPDVHLIMGDFADCEGLSHWPSDSLEPRRIVPEMVEARKLLQEIVEKTPGTSTRLFIEGNHERWIDLALSKMPELFDGLAELGLDINVKKLLALDKFGYDFFELNHLVQIGKAHFTHGIYTGGSYAKKHLDVFNTNIYFGHMHSTQTHNKTSIDGPIEAASLGCLCRLDAKFLRGKPNDWEHTFGVFEFRRDGNYTFYRPRMIDGQFSYNGELFGV